MPSYTYILYLINSIADVPLNNHPIMYNFHMLAEIIPSYLNLLPTVR